MKKKLFFYSLIIFSLCIKQVASLENIILFKINNLIITTIDVKQEEKYLIVLNQNLKKIDKNKLKSSEIRFLDYGTSSFENIIPDA